MVEEGSQQTVVTRIGLGRVSTLVDVVHASRRQANDVFDPVADHQVEYYDNVGIVCDNVYGSRLARVHLPMVVHFFLVTGRYQRVVGAGELIVVGWVIRLHAVHPYVVRADVGD